MHRPFQRLADHRLKSSLWWCTSGWMSGLSVPNLVLALSPRVVELLLPPSLLLLCCFSSLPSQPAVSPAAHSPQALLLPSPTLALGTHSRGPSSLMALMMLPAIYSVPSKLLAFSSIFHHSCCSSSSLVLLPSAALRLYPLPSLAQCSGQHFTLCTTSDYSRGFGGRYGLERDKVDKAAVGFDYKSQAEKHDSQKDYSVGFGGKFGVQRDRQDKSALGWDHQEEVQPHASQTDYAKGFGGRYGIQKDRVDKEVPQREKDRTEAASATMPARVPRSADQDRPVSQEGVPRQETKKKDEETSPTLPPRPVDLGEELCRNPSQDQPIYSESLVAGGDYEELPEPSDYCDSTSGGADYEELPAPLGRDAIYDHGGEGGEDYENILPEEPSQSQLLVAEMDNVYDVENPGTCAVALYDYQGDGDDEIYFDADDIITHIEMVDEGWWQGQCHGKIGLFPANYVRLLQ
ncbi:hematopoietic lineage cell-specific protein isoform X6 [Lathamus discolor]|uniref:hematopoietic lineage cell-specific protein isoform X6 n=1 Tax=Lathamus discolor TaxID=678569 RepID=UPI0032B7935C